jgi:hypothetical protein
MIILALIVNMYNESLFLDVPVPIRWSHLGLKTKQDIRAIPNFRAKFHGHGFSAKDVTHRMGRLLPNTRAGDEFKVIGIGTECHSGPKPVALFQT